MAELSQADFSNIVGAIYECATDPARWPSTLQRVCDRIDAAAAGLMVQDLVLARPRFQVIVGADPYWEQLLHERYFPISPFVVQMSFLKAGHVVSVDDVMDYEVFLRGRFYKEWAAPQGLPDSLLGILARSGTRLGAVGISLRRRATDEDKGALAELLPHLARAVAISDLLEFRTAEIARLSAAVDGLTTGVIFLSSDLKVLNLNLAATRMVRERKAVAIENERLLLPNTENGRQLRAAVVASANGRLEQLKTSTVLFEGRDGIPGLVAHVLPIGRNDSSFGGDAVAVVFFTDPEAPVRMPIESLVEQFGLSPSELRVLMGLMQGQTPRELAEAHGIAITTIRTHLRHLFQKTGTTRQMQLVKLAMSMMPPQPPTNGGTAAS